MVHRHAPRLVFGVVLSGCLSWLSGCAGESSSAGPLAPREGLSTATVTTTQYVLHRVDGFPLPRRLCPDRPEIITGATIVLRSDGTFNVSIVYRTNGSPTTRLRASGTYTVQSGNVTFVGSNGVTVTGTLSELGARLSIRFPYCDPPTSHRVIFLRQ